MHTIENLLKDGQEKLFERVVYVEEKQVGILRPSVLWGRDDEGRLYVSGPSGIVRCETEDRDSAWSALVESSAILFGEPSEIPEVLHYLNSPRSSRTAASIISTSRNCDDFLATIAEIHSAKILIVGCGGIGSMVAINLAGAGIRHLHIVDGDHIEESNLNRQFLWSKEDVGLLKVNVLQREINRRYGETLISATCARLSQESLSASGVKYNVVIVTADEPLGLAEEIHRKSDAIVISSGYVHQYAQIQIKRTEKCPESVIKEVCWERNSYFVGPSFGPTNTELAGVISGLAIQALHNKEIPTSSATWDTSSFPRNITSKIVR